MTKQGAEGGRCPGIVECRICGKTYTHYHKGTRKHETQELIETLRDTVVGLASMVNDKDCQIAALKERIEAWRGLPPTVFSEFADHFPEYRKLKDLGEI